MDVHIGRWILEFLLCQSIDNRTLKSLISIIPLSNDDYSLNKLLLLRKIELTIRTCTVPETLLDFLEQIEELNYRDGITVTESMKAAYFSVAFHCTLRFLEKEGDEMKEYCNAVNRIWINRVCKNGGLRSEELDNWKYEIEKGILDESVRKKLVLRNDQNDVLEVVSVFVEEEKDRLGPSFLELLAETLGDYDEVRGVFGSIGNGLCDQVTEDVAQKNIGETCREIVPLRSERCSDANFYNTEGLIDGEKCEKINRVNKLIDLSALEPQLVPKDPFPFTLYMLAETAVASIEREKPDHESQVAPNSCLDLCADSVQADQSDLDSPCCKIQFNGPKHRLMEQNGSARSHEWDDSVNNLPKKMAGSSFNVNETQKLGRRKKRKWSTIEEDTLRTGVQKFGKGNWKFILGAYCSVFVERTEVDLKDKWRNMTHQKLKKFS